MIIAGAKGFAKELLQVYFRDYSSQEILFFDNINDDVGNILYDQYHVIRSIEELSEFLNTQNAYCLGVGTPKARKTLFDIFTKLGGTLKKVISNKSNIGSFGTLIGEGCTIVDGVTITNDISIGTGTLINLNCTIGHDSIIGNFCDISPAVNISGHCKIGNYCSIGTGAILIPGVSIGDNCIIGAGSVITTNIPENSLVVGVPGKIIKSVEPFLI